MSVQAAPVAMARCAAPVAERMRVRGTVQGVGFRPTVWRIASELGVVGSVVNDAQGVLIVAVAAPEVLDALAQRLRNEAPPLARIESLERLRVALPVALPQRFQIGPSQAGVAADAALAGVAATRQPARNASSKSSTPSPAASATR